MMIWLMLSAAIAGQAQAPQPTTPAQQQAESPKPDSQNQRIVDPAKMPKPDPKQDKSLSAKIDRVLTRFEDTKMLEQIKIFMNNPYVHARFGGIGDGSGFGLGVEFTNNASKPSNVRLSSILHATFRQYVLATAGISVDPTGGKRERFQLDFTGRYQLRPRDNFYGLGPDSFRSNRSNYDLQERGFNFAAGWKVTKSVRLGAGLDFSAARVFDGQDPRFAKTPKLFPTLPGLTRGASLLSPQLFIEFDKRNNPGNATKGVYANFVASSNDSVGKDDFGFVNMRMDVRGYVPLGTPRRVFAARLIGNFNNPKGGSEIPFYRLAHIGDTQTMRGYRQFRFYGRNALAANFEYRFELIPGIGALAFTDVGQVFDRRTQITAQNLHATWGGGIEFKSKKSTLFRILVGRSGEGTRIIIGFGPTF
ncbi:MAG: BamA/TamA family outer membrane protein [Blastocatellia bacterium]|nr:BamA/TamA family outer membrane protein [Blastocatellia bacterium]